MRWTHRYVQALTAGLAAGLSIVLLGIVWDATWEGRPTGAELASDLDLFIREFKQQVADRDSVEHIFGVGTDDNGLARLGSARGFIQNAAPTDMVGPGQFNSTADVFPGAALADEEVGASTVDQGTGRLWVDADGLDGAAGTTDDRQLNVWVDAVGFQTVTASPAIELAGGNLIYNGSFEVTDGTGSLASTTVASGWANLSTATIGYQSVNDSTEGDGVAMRTTAAGGANEGARQTLVGLKEAITYVYRARVRATAGDTCNLTVGDGTTTITDTSLTTAVFETLEVTHTTTAGPADVTVDLRSTADTDVCDWDHVTAFERNAVVAPPGIQAIFTQDSVEDATIDTTFGNNPFLATTIRVPSRGYAVQIDTTINMNSLVGTAMYARLARDDCAGGAFTAVTPVYGGLIDNSGTYPVHIAFVDVAPVLVGGPCIYRVEVREGAGANGIVNDLTAGDAVQTGSSLRLMLLPTR